LVVLAEKNLEYRIHQRCVGSDEIFLASTMGYQGVDEGITFSNFTCLEIHQVQHGFITKMRECFSMFRTEKGNQRIAPITILGFPPIKINAKFCFPVRFHQTGFI